MGNSVFGSLIVCLYPLMENRNLYHPLAERSNAQGGRMKIHSYLRLMPGAVIRSR